MAKQSSRPELPLRLSSTKSAMRPLFDGGSMLGSFTSATMIMSIAFSAEVKLH